MVGIQVPCRTPGSAQVPPRIWISHDDRVEFDNYEDCCSYNNEMCR
jgi:hypothetical protein